MRAVRSWKARGRELKAETYALNLVYRDPRVPWLARLVAACAVGYAFIPLDMIPDFIPILGWLEDLLLVPLGIALALRMIPEPIMAECRERARVTLASDRLTSWVAAGTLVAIRVALFALAAFLAVHAAGG